MRFISGLSLKPHFFAALLLASHSALALAPLEPEPVFGDTAQAVIQRLEGSHYSHQAFNDALSERALQEYLKTLDPAHMFLLQSDVEKLKKYRHALDEALKTGDLDAGFAIFNLYRQRAHDRLEWLLADLPALLAAMDYTVDESTSLDRENAAWPRDDKEAREIWRQQLKASALNLKLAGKADKDIEPTLRKRYSSQLDRIKQIKAEDAFETYINAVSAVYDPHTQYFSPQRSKNFNISMSLSLEGIGAVLEKDDEHTKVVRLVHAGPADKQGLLKPADKIIGVGQGKDGEIVDVIGWRLDDVVDLIRGEKGTTVRLQVIPANASNTEKTRIVELVRDTVKLEDQAAKKHIIDIKRDGKVHKVGVIDIPTFYMDFAAMRNGDENFKSTTRDVAELIRQLQQEKVEGIVVDLRDNGGGSLREATLLTGLFIDNGFTVQIRSANGRVEREAKPLGMPNYNGPLVVLIDRLSASASEIFAGAIQDYQRGLIVGSGSFGKGTVQTMVSVEHGDLKLTEAKFYRVSGESTQHRGVVPDIEFPAIYDPKLVGESALTAALPWDTIGKAEHAQYFPYASVIGRLRDEHIRRTQADPDFVYFQEQRQLRDRQAAQKQVSLNEKVRKAQDEAIKAEALAIENKRRKAKGQEPLAKLDTPDEDEDGAGKDPAEDEDKKAREDAYLIEASKILLDSAELLGRTASANR